MYEQLGLGEKKENSESTWRDEGWFNLRVHFTSNVNTPQISRFDELKSLKSTVQT